MSLSPRHTGSPRSPPRETPMVTGVGEGLRPVNYRYPGCSNFVGVSLDLKF
jgi:hypothetical protein